MITVTGSSGKTGRALIRALLSRRAPVRAVVHRPGLFPSVEVLGAVEVALADLTDFSSLERAFVGSSAVYHICPNMREDEEEIGQRVIEACRRAGVERLVYHSVLHPQLEAMPHHWRKLRVEERLIESGLAFTILQPAAYMQNLKQQWSSITERGLYEVPYAKATRLGMVDLTDMAEAAAEVLCGTGHEGATYELCGSEVFDQQEIADVLSHCLNRVVEVTTIQRDRWARRARKQGLSAPAVEGLIAMFRHYERHGFWGSSTVLEGLLGRPPTPLATVVDRWRTRDSSLFRRPS